MDGQLSARDAALPDMMRVLSLAKEAQTSINHSFTGQAPEFNGA